MVKNLNLLTWAVLFLATSSSWSAEECGALFCYDMDAPMSSALRLKGDHADQMRSFGAQLTVRPATNFSLGDSFDNFNAGQAAQLGLAGYGGMQGPDGNVQTADIPDAPSFDDQIAGRVGDDPEAEGADDITRAATGRGGEDRRSALGSVDALSRFDGEDIELDPAPTGDTSFQHLDLQAQQNSVNTPNGGSAGRPLGNNGNGQGAGKRRGRPSQLDTPALKTAGSGKGAAAGAESVAIAAFDDDDGDGSGSKNSKKASALALRKYLKKPRKVAGSVGPDGITGSFGPSLFEKVTNRYNLHRGSLKP